MNCSQELTQLLSYQRCLEVITTGVIFLVVQLEAIITWTLAPSISLGVPHHAFFVFFVLFLSLSVAIHSHVGVVATGFYHSPSTHYLNRNEKKKK
jgi:hypothetical protein